MTALPQKQFTGEFPRIAPHDLPPGAAQSALNVDFTQGYLQGIKSRTPVAGVNAPVLESPTPTYDPITQGYREVAPAQDSLGNWMRTYEVYDLDPEQAAAKNEQIQKSIVDQTQARLDDFAKTRGYDGILSLATYATSTVPKFQTEGQYGVTARDTTWAKLYEIMSEVEAGTREYPTSYVDIESELLVLT